MELNHYLEVRLQHLHGISNGQFAEMLVRQVHHYNSRQDESSRLAIAFPELSLEHHGIGRKFHVFGTLNALENFVNQPGVAQLQAMPESFVQSVRPVPADINEYRAYVRDRKQEKRTVAFVARKEERAIRRAMTGKNKALKGPEDLLKQREDLLEAIAVVDSDSTKPYSLTMTSCSTDRLFSLFFLPLPSDNNSRGNLNSYGLSSQQAPVGLPVIK